MDSKCIGWLLHVSVEQDKVVLWIKTEDKKILRLVDSYQPFFYILPRNEYDGAYLFHLLSQQTSVKKVKWEENKSTTHVEIVLDDLPFCRRKKIIDTDPFEYELDLFLPISHNPQFLP